MVRNLIRYLQHKCYSVFRTFSVSTNRTNAPTWLTLISPVRYAFFNLNNFNWGNNVSEACKSTCNFSFIVERYREQLIISNGIIKKNEHHKFESGCFTSHCLFTNLVITRLPFILIACLDDFIASELTSFFQNRNSQDTCLDVLGNDRKYLLNIWIVINKVKFDINWIWLHKNHKALSEF